MPATAMTTDTHLSLPADTNQALGLAQYAIDFMGSAKGKRGNPSGAVLERTGMFYTDACLCGVSVFGSKQDVAVEKAIVANCAAVREWDSNGTNFGFNPELGHTAGEFGHNDFYSVP